MFKQVGTSMVLVAAAAAAGTIYAAKATPEPAKPVTVSRAVPAGDKPFAPICKSDGVIEGKPDPAWVGQSFANDHCLAPSMPVAIDGAKASREQVVAGMAAGERYAAAAVAFERCVQKFVDDRKTGGQAISTPLVIIENHRIAASRRNTQLVAARVRATIVSFNEYGSDCGG